MIHLLQISLLINIIRVSISFTSLRIETSTKKFKIIFHPQITKINNNSKIKMPRVFKNCMYER